MSNRTDTLDRRQFTALLGTGATLAVAGCLGGDDEAEDDESDPDSDDGDENGDGSADIVEVELGDGDEDAERGDGRFEFDPAELTIETGTTVRFVNTHNTPHTVTTTDSLDDLSFNDGKFDESLSSEGDSFEYTFEEASETLYYCRPHPVDMQGRIEVE